MSLCFIGLGSNLGDRLVYLQVAVNGLARENLDPVLVSSVYETTPVDCREEQENYLNAVVGVESDKDPHDLVHTALAIEDAIGRKRPTPNAPRTIDIDILLAGDTVCTDTEACVPHPRMCGRLFVLTPLREIAANTVIPGTGLTVDECYHRCRGESHEVIRLFAPPAVLKPVPGS
jgi:2-amino-4-hydroxy-6-hydroxymethyldihydropteridine diphosphokinase